MPDYAERYEFDPDEEYPWDGDNGLAEWADDEGDGE